MLPPTDAIHRIGRPRRYTLDSMSTTKEEVRRLLDTLPDDATLEDVQYSIYVRERIERARREAEQGNVLEQAEVERRAKRWLEE